MFSAGVSHVDTFAYLSSSSGAWCSGGREVFVGARTDLCLVFQLSGRCCITTPLWAVWIPSGPWRSIRPSYTFSTPPDLGKSVRTRETRSCWEGGLQTEAGEAGESRATVREGPASEPDTCGFSPRLNCSPFMWPRPSHFDNWVSDFSSVKEGYHC